MSQVLSGLQSEERYFSLNKEATRRHSTSACRHRTKMFGLKNTQKEMQDLCNQTMCHETIGGKYRKFNG